MIAAFVTSLSLSTALAVGAPAMAQDAAAAAPADGPTFAPGTVVYDSAGAEIGPIRSEEHTSELQSLMRISYAVFCLKKKIQIAKADVLINIPNAIESNIIHTE